MSNEEIKSKCLSAASRLEQAGLLKEEQVYVVINAASQRLMVCRDTGILFEYPVSTAANGPGCEIDSFKTPTGIHRIAEKIGGDQAEGMIFESRVPTGEIADIQNQPVDSDGDLITSRILWLEGMEPGINRGGEVDSYQRYIYIHGTNEEGRLGQAVSHGCIRLANADVILLFDAVRTGTPVVID